MPPTNKSTIGWWRALVALAAVVLPAGVAHAWLETTVMADDVRLAVERDGHAVVEHQVMMRVRGSPMRSFALPGVDPDAQPEGEAVAIPQHDGASAHVEPQVPLAVQTLPERGACGLAVDAGQGLPRGTYVLKFRYRTDLVKNGALERDGQMVMPALARPPAAERARRGQDGGGAAVGSDRAARGVGRRHVAREHGGVPDDDAPDARPRRGRAGAPARGSRRAGGPGPCGSTPGRSAA